MLDMQLRTAFGEDHHMFRDIVRKVFDDVLIPNLDKHEADGIVPRKVWRA